MDKLIGFLLPPAIDFINTHIEDSDARFWVSVMVCSVVATIWHYFAHSGFMGADSLASDILQMFGVAQLSYGGVWSNDRVLGNFRDDMGLNAKEK